MRKLWAWTPPSFCQQRCAAQLPPPLLQAISLVDSLVTPIPPLLVFAYFLDCCGEGFRRSPVMRVQCSLGTAMVATRIAGQLSGEIKAAPESKLRFGFWLALSALLMLLLAVVCFAALIRRWKKLTNTQRDTEEKDTEVLCVIFLSDMN